MAEMTPAPAAAAPAQPGQPPKQPPFGSTPATAPTPNKGFEAAGAQKLGIMLKMATNILPMVGPASDIGQVLLDFLKKASKFVPSGSVTPAAEKNNIEGMAMKNAQGNQQMQALQQMRAQQAQGGAPKAA